MADASGRPQPAPAGSPTPRKAPVFVAPSFMEQDLASRAYEAAEKKREQEHVASRAAKRLDHAADRHCAAREQLDADTESARARLQQKAEHSAGRAQAIADDTAQSVAEHEAFTREQERHEERHVNDRDDALQRVADSRERREQHTARIDEEMQNASEQAHSAITSSRADTRAKLDALRQQRQDIQDRFHRDAKVRAQDSDDLIRRVTAQSAEHVLKVEGYRHRAAKAVDYAGELAQAARTTGQGKVQKNEGKAAKQAADMALTGHKTQAQCDVHVKRTLRDSKAELEAAHDYCLRVKVELDQEATDYARRMRQLEHDGQNTLKDVHRKVHMLECERLQNFDNDFGSIKDAEAQFRSKRDSCEEELEAVKRRLREVGAETEATAKRLLANWDASDADAESAVRQLEQKGKDAINEMQKAIASTLGDCTSRKKALQQGGVDKIGEIIKQAHQELDSTQPTLEAKRRADEEAAAAAIASFFELKKAPPAIQAAADADIAASMAQAQAEGERIQGEADARTAAAKAAMKAAHEDERWLLAETAGAWARLRKACHQLRLMNLHDFSQSIVAGEYDVPMPSIAQQ